MKVGLCTRYDNRNYGSMLQAFATQIAIEKLGHSCELIRYTKQYNVFDLIKQAPRVLNGGSIAEIQAKLINTYRSRTYPEINRLRKQRDRCFDNFRDKVFTSLSREYVGYDNLREGSNGYNAVVVGSDQLWLPVGLGTNFYNLQFVADGIRRVSYATSFGVSNIPWYQRSRTADYLRKINYLSVREDSGAKICQEIAGVKAKVVVDPTLLLTKDDWYNYIPDECPVTERYIFCYFLGNNDDCRREAKKLSKISGLPIVTLRHLDEIVHTDEAFGDIAPYDIDPWGFVNYIRHAEFVLPDSFHGTVFSIIHHKDFITFYRFKLQNGQSTNSRIDSLLSNLGLQDRLYKFLEEALS